MKTSKKDRYYANILGVHVDSRQVAQVLSAVEEKVELNGELKAGTALMIVTPNPEIILKAQKDVFLKTIINKADLRLADGVGLASAYEFLLYKTPNFKPLRPFILFGQGMKTGWHTLRKQNEDLFTVIKGRELFIDLLKLADQKSWKVFLLGGLEGSAEKTAEKMAGRFPNIKFEFDRGPVLDNKAQPVSPGDEDQQTLILKMINSFKPHLLFVGFGAPKQEKWLYKWRRKLNIGAGMVVGGTFDYVSGKTKLPPAWVTRSGMEWGWRLVTGSNKPLRVFKAFPIFPLKVYWHKLRAD